MKKRILKTAFRMSRDALLGLLVCCLFAHLGMAENSSAQSIEDVFVEISAENNSVENILDDIENTTSFSFLYGKYRIDAMPHRISFSAKKRSVADILRIISRETGLLFRQINSTITVKTADIFPIQTKEQVQEEIEGTVSDDQSGETLPGVNILVKGTSIGTSTDQNGDFALTVPSLKDTLVVSFVGYQTQEVPIEGQTKLNNIQLSSTAILGEEVVVVGYGSENQKDLTGSVSTVEGADLSKRKGNTQLSQSLQGSFPGVMVRRSSSMPGASADIKIRGITTIGNSDPLIIVDGVPRENIDDINQNDVEQMTVLKDASAASIYGARAAAGVILITTKNAEVGETNFEVNSNVGIQGTTTWPETVGPIRYMEMFNEMQWNDAGNPEDGEYTTFSRDEINNWIERHKTNPDEYPLTDWQDLLINDYAASHDHQLAISHGNEVIQTRASIQYKKDEALYDYRNYERIMTSLNNNITFSDYLTSKVYLSFNRSISENPSINPLRASYQYPAIYAAMYEDGRVAPGKEGSNTYARVHEGGFHNGLNNKLNGRLSMKFNPLEELSITGVISPSYNTYYEKDFNKQIPFTASDDPTRIIGYVNGHNETSLNEYRGNFRSLTKQLLVNYQDSFADNHNLDFLAGYEDYYQHRERFDGQSIGLQVHEFPYMDTANQDNTEITGAANEYAYRSLFSRLKYNFNRKYYIQGNIRVDGSSRFHPDHRWGYFPSFSAGWVISNESFMSDIQHLSFLKIRGSLGTLGNERIGNYPYQPSVNLTTNPLFWTGGDIISRISAAQVSYAVRDITWESTQTWNIGIDMNLFDDRVEMVFDYYQKDTRDMLLNLEIPDYMGYDNPDQNAGTMTTEGWELELGWQDQVGELSYSVRANLSDFISTMGDLKGTEFLGDQIIREGSEFNEWYGYLSDGIFQTEEEVENSPVLSNSTRAGDIKYIDISGPDGEPDGQITPEHDKVLLGGSLPRYTYGGNINLNYKNVGLSVVVQGVGKQNRRMARRMVQPFEGQWLSPPGIIENNYWSHYNSDAENSNAEFPRITLQNADENYTMSDYWLFDGSYFRLKNISLSYTIPARLTEKISVDELTIYSNISDLFSIDNFPEGWDPEMSSNSYISQTYTFGVNINF